MEFRQGIQEYIRFFLLIAVITYPSFGDSQSSESILEKRKELLENIDNITQIINKIDQQISATTKNYNLLETKILKRQELLRNIEDEKKFVSTRIDSMGLRIQELNMNLSSLRQEYNRLLKQNYIRSLTEQRWAYIMSSKTLMQAYKRWIFSKQYKDFLDTQREDLTANLQAVQKTADQLTKERDQKEQLLLAENLQTKQMEKEQTQKDQVLAGLEKDQDKLKTDLDEQKSKRQKSIATVKTVINSNSTENINGSEKRENYNPAAFKSQKNNLIWPLESAIVVSAFGKQEHPTLENVIIENNGIDLENVGAKTVKVVFDGKVVGKKSLQDQGLMVIIKHENYYTVYSKLIATTVKSGDILKSGDVIGEIQEGLHFEIWSGKEKLNPLHWLRN